MRVIALQPVCMHLTAKFKSFQSILIMNSGFCCKKYLTFDLHELYFPTSIRSEGNDFMHGGNRCLCACAAHSGSRWCEVNIYKEANVELSHHIRKYLQTLKVNVGLN